MDYRVIIAGGRDFDNDILLRDSILSIMQDRLHKDNIIIISGRAKGADLLGERFAQEYGLCVEAHPADWKKHGRAAGPIRNAEMAEVADALIAFWDGKSKGTSNMISLARKKGLSVNVVNY